MGHARVKHMVALLALLVTTALPATSQARASAFTTTNQRWQATAGDFAAWQRSGVDLAADGQLVLNAQQAQAASDPYPAGGYQGHNYYNGGSFLVGEATSPAYAAGFAFTEAIVSWNASTPAGTWVELQLRAQLGSRWTKWYTMGVWAADSSTVERHSVNGQSDADGYVAVDTLVLTTKKAAASGYQIKARLFSASAGALPSVSATGLALSTTASAPKSLQPGNAALWDRLLAVPTCSQMVYPDGGEVWCSPTSVAMVLAYWQGASDPCEPRVRAAVAGVYDWLYDGHGNWPFNTAYAASQGLAGQVARMSSMAQLEPWLAAGVPVVISFAWGNGDLTGAAIPTSNGHLAVLVGFDGAGNPIVNDPAAASDGAVQRTYLRAELEALWLEHSGGTVYLIYPPGWATPAL